MTENGPIAFICGSAEAERDGVADYSRCLAQQINTLGHHTEILSLADTYIDTPRYEAQDGVSIYRLPEKLPISKRIQLAKTWIDDVRPSQFSIQYVPFAFHPKGLPLSLINRFSALVNHTPLHWMCHEVWCGLSSKSKMKEKVLGTAQRLILKNFLRSAASIQTSNPSYRELLAEITNKPIHLLPLFGSIPFERELSSLVRSNWRKQLAKHHDSESIFFLIFGRIAADFPSNQFLSYLDDILLESNKRGCIISIGRLDRGEIAWDEFRNLNCKNIDYVRLGETSRQDIDSIIQSIDFGLATTPLEGIGKSSTAMAILERGKPLIGYYQRKHIVGIGPDIFPTEQIITLDNLKRSPSLLDKPPVFSAKSIKHQVAERFLEIIQQQ